MVASFQEQIKILVELQKLDSAIFNLKRELSLQPDQQKKLELDFDKKKVHLKAAEDALKAEQVKQKDKENTLGSMEEKIKKLQAQLYQLKSNKEYQAMEFEIKAAKADKSLLEEEILVMMDSVESSKQKVAKEKSLLAEEEKKFKEDIEVLKKKASQIQAELVGLEEKRKTYVPNIDKKFLDQYERVLVKRDGVALVPLKEGTCGGCHLKLPPQVANEIQMQDKIIFCESCARMLYFVP